MNYIGMLLEVNISDITGILQVVLAVFSIVADIVLVFVAAKINNRNKENHIANVIESTSNIEDHQPQQDIQIRDETKINKVKKLLQKIDKNNKNGLSVMKFIKEFKDICTEAKTVKILRRCQNRGISWTGLLAVDTIISIDNNKIDELSKIIVELI